MAHTEENGGRQPNLIVTLMVGASLLIAVILLVFPPWKSSEQASDTDRAKGQNTPIYNSSGDYGTDLGVTLPADTDTPTGGTVRPASAPFELVDTSELGVVERAAFELSKAMAGNIVNRLDPKVVPQDGPPIASAEARITINISTGDDSRTVFSGEDGKPLEDEDAMIMHIYSKVEEEKLSDPDAKPTILLRGDKDLMVKHAKKVAKAADAAGVNTIVFSTYQLKEDN